MVVLSIRREGRMEMELSNPREVLNLDGFLPLDGEDRIDLFSIDGDLCLDIFYESTDSVPCGARCRIVFHCVKYVIKSPFPGYSFFNSPADRDLLFLNSLVEYGNSDLADIDNKNSPTNDSKHYRIFLHSSGIALHVVAEKYEITNERMAG
jgi:hypothetical protein